MDPVTLWHGTTASAAERLVADGFKAVDAREIVATTAAEFGADCTQVLDTLCLMHRFVVGQDERNRSAWFAATPNKAARWAQRAPEARWEALWAVRVIRCGSDPRSATPWNDTSSAGWHARQLWSDPPAVVEVRVPADRLQGADQQVIGDLESFVQLAPEGLWPEVSVSHPLPRDWVVGFETIDRTVDFTAAAGILGMTTEELTSAVHANEIARPRRPSEPLDDWYWTLAEFKSCLEGRSASTDMQS